MVCKLCQGDSELKNSHIIPEAFFEGVYDAKHRALPLSLQETKLQFIQKGMREKLLCDACEQKFSKWESILKMDLVDIGNKKSNFLRFSQLTDKGFQVEGIRYKEFKLAILSILWRMSVSSDEFFSSYSLGQYEKKLRHVFMSDHTLDEKEYPIMVSRFELDGVFYPNIIMGFPPAKYGQVFAVQRFAIWGHCFTVFVNDKRFPQVPLDVFLRNSGRLDIDICSLVETASP